MAHHKFVLKLLKTTVFGKKAFGKRKEISKDKCVTVKERVENKELYFWKAYSRKMPASLSCLWYAIQFTDAAIQTCS